MPVEMDPKDNAVFAVLSRFLSCIVTEQIILAFYTPTPELGKATGVMVVLSPTLTFHPDHTITANDVLVCVLLRHSPVLLDRASTKYGRRVGLVDPLDMLPGIFGLAKVKNCEVGSVLPVDRILRYFQGASWDFRGHSLKEIKDPRALWYTFSRGITINEQSKEAISKELDSSLYYQHMVYKDPPRCPSLQSSPIEWEQSLVTGHPTHPMHRARLLPSELTDYDWYRPLVRFAQVPKCNLDIHGSFQQIGETLVKSASKNVDITLDHARYTYIPLHELQLVNIFKLFPNATVLPSTVSLPAFAQSSIRTVTVAELPGHALKLAIGVKISSSLRTISHFTADFGPRFSREIVPRLSYDRDILTVELELHSVVYRCKDPEVQKHFTAVVREEYEPNPDECVIVCAALLETGHSNTPPGISAVEHVFGLDSEPKRIQFVDRFIELSTRALIPALVINGVAFEAHAQNMLLRVNRNAGQLLGFVIRDLGGLRIHPETLRHSTGIDFEFLPKHCIATGTLEEIYPKFYHTYVHNHVQRLIRLLDLHDNGIGWKILRKHMSAVIPLDHPLRKLWLSPDSKLVQSKCLMRMRMQDSYRDMVYNPYPNMIQFRPESVHARRQRSL